MAEGLSGFQQNRSANASRLTSQGSPSMPWPWAAHLYENLDTHQWSWECPMPTARRNHSTGDASLG